MSYENTTNNTTAFNNNEERARFDPSSTFASGGLNNSTGREPFEDPRSDFATPDAPAQAVAGNLHVGHEHNHGLTGNNYSSGTGIGSGLTGSSEHHHHSHGTGLERDSTYQNRDTNYESSGLNRDTNYGTSGVAMTGNQHSDITTGTSQDHALRTERQSGHLTGGVLADRQTGDQPGGVQTGSSSYGTGRDATRGDDEHRGIGEKLKDAVSGNKDDDYNHRTVGHGAHTGNAGLTGGHPAAGITGGSDSTTYGSNTAARDYDQSTSAAGYDRTGGVGNQGVGAFQGSNNHGPLSGGAAGTDRFDTEHGHSVGDKSSNDHKLSGLTRHGDDFTKGDTADSAYKNYDATGLTGREHTTTGVHDNNLEGTGAHKAGIFDKVKNLIGGHTNTTHADHK